MEEERHQQAQKAEAGPNIKVDDGEAYRTNSDIAELEAVASAALEREAEEEERWAARWAEIESRSIARHAALSRENGELTGKCASLEHQVASLETSHVAKEAAWEAKEATWEAKEATWEAKEAAWRRERGMAAEAARECRGEQERVAGEAGSGEGHCRRPTGPAAAGVGSAASWCQSWGNGAAVAGGRGRRPEKRIGT